MSKRSKEFLGMKKEELQLRADDLRKELVKLKAQAKTSGMKNPSKIKELKKNIARALTFANKKE